MSDASARPSSFDVSDFVRNTDFFRLVDEPLQQELAANLERVSLAEGEYLFQQGDPGDDGLYAVIEGHLNVLGTRIK